MIPSCWRMTHSQRTTCSSWTSSSSSPSLTFSMTASPTLLAGSRPWRSLFLARFPISSLVLAVNFGLVSPILDETRRSWACIRSLGTCDGSSGTYLFGRSSSVGSSSQQSKLTSLMVRSSKLSNLAGPEWLWTHQQFQCFFQIPHLYHFNTNSRPT